MDTGVTNIQDDKHATTAAEWIQVSRQGTSRLIHIVGPFVYVCVYTRAFVYAYACVRLCVFCVGVCVYICVYLSVCLCVCKCVLGLALTEIYIIEIIGFILGSIYFINNIFITLYDNISLKRTFILRVGKTRKMRCSFLKRNSLYYFILFIVCVLF
jgi:hypothetical protein